MIIAQSFWRKAVVTAIAASGFVGLYEARALDSNAVAWLSGPETADSPTPGTRLLYVATAYCKGLTTTSGVAVQSGVAAADPALLPVGSVVDVASRDEKYSGIYTVMDTGPSVQGRQVDLYMWSCNEALSFGRQSIRLTVLRLGWNPHATTPSFLQRFFKRAGAEPAPLPSRPLPQVPPPDADSN
jgi:3D (Asp-Asp-Asp) domain-containing protein